MDTRLLTTIPVAVAKAAMESGIARKPIQDFDAYKESLRKLGAECSDGVCYPFMLQTPEMLAKVAARLGLAE
jgi:hypothetical protein